MKEGSRESDSEGGESMQKNDQEQAGTYSPKPVGFHRQRQGERS